MSAEPTLFAPLGESLMNCVIAELDLFDDGKDSQKERFEVAKTAFEEQRTKSFEEAQALPRSTETEQNLAEGLIECILFFWKGVARTSAPEKLQTTHLESSFSLAALLALFDACRVLFSSEGAILARVSPIAPAIVGAVQSQRVKDGDAFVRAEGQFIEAIQWWGDEICEKRLGFKDAWNGPRAPDCHTALEVAALAATPALVSFLVEVKGADVNGDVSLGKRRSGLVEAFRGENEATFDRLLELGADPCIVYEESAFKCSFPDGLRMFAIPLDRPPEHVGDTEVRVRMLRRLLSRHPGIATLCGVKKGESGDVYGIDLLSAAIHSRQAGIVELAVETGACPFRFREEARTLPDGTVVKMMPTLPGGLQSANYEVVKLLLCKYKLSERWRERYDEETLGDIAQFLADAAVGAFPLVKPEECPPDKLPAANSDGLRVLDLAFSLGEDSLTWVWKRSHDNAIVSHIYGRKSHWRSVLAEDDALLLLRRYHDAGVCVVKGSSAAPDPGEVIPTLADIAATNNHLKILDFAIEECGCPVDGPSAASMHKTLLAASIQYARIAVIIRLLTKHRAATYYLDQPPKEQPLMLLLQYQKQYSDELSARLVKIFAERDPGFLQAPCFKTVPGTFADPLAQAAFLNRPRTLEAFITCVPAGRQVALHRNHDNAALAAKRGNWECLSVLLDQTDIQVSRGNPSAADIVRSAVSHPANPPPRALVIKVEARERKEKEEARARARGIGGPAARAGTGATATGGTPSNSFEDPSLRPVAARAGGSKGRKKAGKRKGKAKKGPAGKAKQAGAGAGAAAGGDISSSDDDDDETDEEEPFEEPDDNLVDSRFAPSLDIMLAERAMKLAEAGDCTSAE